MGPQKATFIVDTSKSPYARLSQIPIENVRLEDGFWAPCLNTLTKITLPSQYKMLEKSGCLFNFRRASGKETGNFKGPVFIDSDAYKWIEAAAFSLAYSFNEDLYNLVKEVVKEIASAQDEDGYLDTYFTFEKKRERWTNIRDMHELYCAGHLIQAAVALFRATGNSDLLEAACRFADHIATVFGPGKRFGTSGHPEVEMALVELYRLTGNENYLNLARFFIENRGRGLIGGRLYHIDHKPFRELTEIVGHAVRSLYLNCGVTDLYLETGDQTLLDTLTRLWHNMTEKKMYVTGGVGSRYEGEAFGEDYELPNARAYAETCAAIANVMWNLRMLLATGNAKFADLMELALYNSVLSGISLNGEEYFYVNPLADRGRHRRQKWFDCACCPPNVARLLASLPGYFYGKSREGIWIHLYAQSTVHIDYEGCSVTVFQRTDYPWDGEIEITVKPERPLHFSLFLRIPGWCRKAEVSINGQAVSEQVSPGRYFEINRLWKDGDSVKVYFPMQVEKIRCHPYVMENTCRVALKRGPLIYCLEQVDNPGIDVWKLTLSLETPFEAKWREDMLNGVVVIEGEAFVTDFKGFEGHLYRRDGEIQIEKRQVKFTAIPYYAWANRELGPMTVWILTS